MRLLKKLLFLKSFRVRSLEVKLCFVIYVNTMRPGSRLIDLEDA